MGKAINLIVSANWQITDVIHTAKSQKLDPTTALCEGKTELAA